MPLLFKNLPAGLAEQYASGKCMYLASALHRRFGYPIEVAIADSATAHAYVEHAWVVEPVNGDVIDIDGQYPAEANGWLRPSAEHRQGMDEKALFELVTCTSYLPIEDIEWQRDVDAALALVDQYLVTVSPSRFLPSGSSN